MSCTDPECASELARETRARNHYIDELRKSDLKVEYLQGALEKAWGLIANAGGGDWDSQDPAWKAAAETWRDTHWSDISAPLVKRATR